MATKEETETVITWTSADTMATVYTMHDRIRKRCAKVGTEINPRVGIRDGKKVAWTFLVPIDRITIRPPKITPKHGFKKRGVGSPINSDDNTPPNSTGIGEIEQKVASS